MKQVSVASKALTLIFLAMFVVACSSGPSKEEQAAAEAAAAKQAQMEADAAAKKAADEKAAAAAAALKSLEDAAAAAGNTVYFGFDEYSLSSDTRTILDAHIALAKASSRNVRLEGHTDERGTREYNMALGERRAKAVSDYMSGNGVASYKIETVSYGEERPAAQGSGEANWSQNRRVEIR
jgi:peptidoglycan-associated lipoprotein